MAIEPIEEFWRYATSGSPSRFSLVSLATHARVTFQVYAVRPGRDGKLAGHGVRGQAQGTGWVYLGAIDPETRQLKLASERLEGLPQVRALVWLLGKLAAEEWPIRNAELWHAGNCWRCHRHIGRRAPLPPYPVCSYDCAPEPVQAPPTPAQPVTQPEEIDDELPVNVHRFPRNSENH